MNEHHENRVLLEGVSLPKSQRASAAPAEVLRGPEIVILVLPSAFLRNVAG